MAIRKGTAAQHMLGAQRTFQLYQAAMQAFQAELVRENWVEAEKERLAAVTALEDYLDHLMQGNMISAQERKNTQ